jgi:MFS superfamily sulfate permease-like transporter
VTLLRRIFPFLTWFTKYNTADLRADFVSGLTVAMVLIPQSMAYAQLAGLPPYYGLYASFIPPMIAALFGSSRQLATGPVAVVSLMTAASIGPLATAGSEGYIAYAVLLALAVGIFQLALGLFRLGLLVNLLSHPVVAGFTNAAAIIIATSQLSKLFGVSVDNADHHYETIARVIAAAWRYTHWPTLGMGLLAFGIMYGVKRINPRLPFVLIAVVLTTVLAWSTGFENHRQVSIDAFDSEAVRRGVTEFNEAIAEADRLSAERTRLNARRQETLRSAGAHSLEYLREGHDLVELNYRLVGVQERIVACRHALRTMTFRAVRGEDERLRFRECGRIPEEASTDGCIWRLRVGTVKLDTASLLLTGGGAVVGTIPGGLPGFAIPSLKAADFLTLFPYAMIISLLGFMEAISIAKAMATKTGQLLKPNQELVGQGLANILGAMSQSYPVSGSFSRSAVNLQAGAATGLSSVFTSVAVVTTLCFLTPLMYNLPQATLAAVIMMAVIGLINIPGFVHAWRTHRVDGAIQIVTFVATLAFAPHLDRGIFVGMLLSLGFFLYRCMRPHVARLALHPDGSYRDAAYWGLHECPHLAMLRFDSPLFFANASHFEELISERVRAHPKVREVLLVANGINDMDASGEHVLALMVDNLRSRGVGFSISGLKENVIALMKRTHLYEKIGEEHIYPTQAVAIRTLFERAHRDSSEEACPLVTVRYRESPVPQRG